MSSGVPGLFKFGKNVHIEEFCTLGRLYMKSLCDFRRIEADAVRSDRKEGTHWTFPSDQVKLQMEINGVFQDIPEISGPIRYSRDRDQSINVFCMYALRRKDPQTLIDPKNFGFGDTYILLKDGDEFLRRVRNSPVPQGQQLSWQLVEYVAPATYSGHMGAFRKFNSFEYQSEFRVAMVPGRGEAFSLDIGDLSDITTVGKLSEVNNHIKIE